MYLFIYSQGSWSWPNKLTSSWPFLMIPSKYKKNTTELKTTTGCTSLTPKHFSLSEWIVCRGSVAQRHTPFGTCAMEGQHIATHH